VGLFANPDLMKEQIRKSVTKPVYSVHDYYKTEGPWQRIARSPWFDQATLVVISASVLWIGVDAQYNKEAVLSSSGTGYVVAEALFFAYFVVEWLVRFMAFRRKLNALRDAWFVFDTALLVSMVVDTWAIMMITAFAWVPSGSIAWEPSTLRVLRLLRLFRMARMARIIRAVPDLTVIMKGLVAGARPVSVTLSILAFAIYVFSLLFTQLAHGTDVGARYFGGVGMSMATLLLHGIFLEDIPTVFHEVGAENWVLSALLLVFVLIGSFLVVNLLVGVLVETMRVVAECEQEQIHVSAVKAKLLSLIEEIQHDRDAEKREPMTISKKDFYGLLQIQEAVICLDGLGVDVMGLVDLGSTVFEETSELDVQTFVELVLQLRSSNKATVKDVVCLMNFVRKEFHVLRRSVEDAAMSRC